jgi:hypothetical protein
MVTAELAVLLPALVLLLVVSLRAVAVGVAELQCVDAARVAARSAARGDDPAAAQRAGQAVAPAGATVSVRTAGGQVAVLVRASVRVLPGFSLPVRAQARAVSEGVP